MEIADVLKSIMEEDNFKLLSADCLAERCLRDKLYQFEGYEELKMKFLVALRSD